MGELTVSKLKKYARGDTLVETGTESGGTIRTSLEYGFKTMHTMEINPRYVACAIENFGHNPGVHIYQGDSPDVLQELCPTLTDVATFWLDAHLTGGDSGVSNKYGICPLLEELAAIALSPCKEHVIMIDDCRALGGDGWPTELQIRDAIHKINPNYEITFINGYEDQHPNDILVASVG